MCSTLNDMGAYAEAESEMRDTFRLLPNSRSCANNILVYYLLVPTKKYANILLCICSCIFTTSAHTFAMLYRLICYLPTVDRMQQRCECIRQHTSANVSIRQ